MSTISQRALRGITIAFVILGFISAVSAEQPGPNSLLILSDDHSVPYVTRMWSTQSRPQSSHDLKATSAQDLTA
jgi:hypothetical protein